LVVNGGVVVLEATWQKPEMQVYVFISETVSLRAFTTDQTGGNLPAAYAPWRVSNGGKAITVGDASHLLAVALKAHDYLLVTASNQQLKRKRRLEKLQIGSELD
jgi:hypothetical protein